MKCKNCGGQLKYKIDTQNLECDSCNSKFSVDEIDNDKISEIECSQCGAKFVTIKDIKLYSCAYCGSKNFINIDNGYDFIANKIIPFKYTKEQFKDKIKTNLIGKVDI